MVLLWVLADAVVPPEGWGALGLVGAAAVAGWFSLRTNRQTSEAESTKDDAVAVSSDVAQTLEIVKDLMKQNRLLQRELDKCRQSRTSGER